MEHRIKGLHKYIAVHVAIIICGLLTCSFDPPRVVYLVFNTCVSLCAFFCRDMQKPITVLTGMDYWLDNLMCNVPELAMCFHVDGIVQVGKI